MTRNLKALGLATVFALALSVVVASMALANNPQFTNASGGYPISLHAGQTTQHVFTLQGGRKTECSNVTFTGAMSSATTEQTIDFLATGCATEIAGTKFPATLTLPSSCDILVKAPKTVEGKQIPGTVDLQCSSGDAQVHVYEGSPHKNGLPPTGNEICTFTIKAQSNLGTLTYANLGGTKGIEVTANVSGIAYERVVGSSTNCGAASSTGTYVGTSIFTGTKEGVLQEVHVK